jgi:hypothetical protein
MARRPAVPYFADAVWHITPLTVAELFAMARQHSIGYVVVDRRLTANSTRNHRAAGRAAPSGRSRPDVVLSTVRWACGDGGV